MEEKIKVLTVTVLRGRGITVGFSDICKFRQIDEISQFILVSHLDGAANFVLNEGLPVKF